MSNGIQPSRHRLTEFAGYLPLFAADELSHLPEQLVCSTNEIRLRVNQPIVIMFGQEYRIICEHMPLTTKDIRDTFEKICNYSVYSHQNELANGFVTLPGGHRVGICGTAALDSSGHRTLRDISSLNIRIANEYIGCAKEIMNRIFSETVAGLLLVGPPCSGKTTLLRDIALSLSSPPFLKKVVIVDERGEMAAMYRGEAQNTLGLFCDVLNGYPKGEGIMNAVRTLAPDVIICDEIGSECEVEAIIQGLNAGVAVIASIHARNVKELYTREQCRKMLETDAFAHIVTLKDCTRGIINEITEVNRHDP